MSSSSEMGEGMRRERSSSKVWCVGLRDVGAWREGTLRVLLLVCRPPAAPLVGKPRPFMPFRLKVGCIGVGMRPLGLTGSAPNSEAFSIAGRIMKPCGDCAGWLWTSKSSSSMSISKSFDCDDCVCPYEGIGKSVSSQSDSAGVVASTSETNRGGVSEGRSVRL